MPACRGAASARPLMGSPDCLITEDTPSRVGAALCPLVRMSPHIFSGYLPVQWVTVTKGTTICGLRGHDTWAHLLNQGKQRCHFERQGRLSSFRSLPFPASTEWGPCKGLGLSTLLLSHTGVLENAA